MLKRYDRLIEELPTIAQLLNGTILRNRAVSRTGKASACIFVPAFLLGQKVKVIVVPENSEVAGLRKTLDKKNKKISQLVQENRNIKAESRDPETKNEESEDDENLEDGDAY